MAYNSCYDKAFLDNALQMSPAAYFTELKVITKFQQLFS